MNIALLDASCIVLLTLRSVVGAGHVGTHGRDRSEDEMWMGG